MSEEGRRYPAWFLAAGSGVAFIMCFAVLVHAVVTHNISGAVLFAAFCCGDGYVFVTAERRRRRTG